MIATAATVRTLKFYLNGKWQEATGRSLYPVTDPSAGEVIAQVPGLKGYCYAKTGRTSEALQLLEELKKCELCPALQMAVLCLGLGNIDSAFLWLERAAELRSLRVHWIKVDPMWDPIRPDARFSVLLNLMNLAD